MPKRKKDSSPSSSTAATVGYEAEVPSIHAYLVELRRTLVEKGFWRTSVAVCG